MPVSFFFFSSRRRHTRWPRDWSSDVCSSDLIRASTASLTGLTADSSFEVGCAFIPGQVHAPTEVPTGGAGLAIVRSDSKERQDACAELFRFLAQPEMAAEWHRDTGYIPIVEERSEERRVGKEGGDGVTRW